MIPRWAKTQWMFSFTLIFLLSLSRTSYAALSMEEVRYRFEQEKGTSWDDAAPEEQKSFIRNLESKQQEGPEVFDASALQDREEKAPYEVRYSYESQTGMDWDSATDEEQKNYLKKYEKKEKQRKKKEELFLKKIKREEEKREKEYLDKKKEIERQEKKKRREEEKKRREIIKQRKENKKRLENEKKKLERLRRKSHE